MTVISITELSERELQRWARKQFGFAADAWRAADGLWFVAWSRGFQCCEANSIQSAAMTRAIEAHQAQQAREDAAFAETLARI